MSHSRPPRERSCDKWYDNPFVVRYFFSRALAPIAPEAGTDRVDIMRKSDIALYRAKANGRNRTEVEP